MKIKLAKKRNSVILQFTAANDAEGVDLKDIVVAASKHGLTIGYVLKEFGARGYNSALTKDTGNTKEFSLSVPPPSSIAAPTQPPVCPECGGTGVVTFKPTDEQIARGIVHLRGKCPRCWRPGGAQ